MVVVEMVVVSSVKTLHGKREGKEVKVSSVEQQQQQQQHKQTNKQTN